MVCNQASLQFISHLCIPRHPSEITTYFCLLIINFTDTNIKMFSLRRAALRTFTSITPASVSCAKPIVSSSQYVLRQKISASLPTFAIRKFSSEDESIDKIRGSQVGGAYVSTNPEYDAAGEGAARTDRGFGAPVDLSPNPSIYVGNLVFDLTAEDIKREFSPYGEVKNVTLATDGRGMSKGFGYVEYGTIEEAEAAIEAKNQTVLEGRRLIVNFQAKARRSMTENPPSKTLFIGNIAFEMSDADLNKVFRDIRNVVDVRVAVDRRTGQPRGFAHADFVSVEDAVAAKEVLTDLDVFGRKLRIDFSAGIKGRPSSDRT
ncbi:hypothetical protein K3495_g894 [Podosphaera aphanis]|nr:hypothetical protein K3495_g894 [Podosphaera aphanis]